MDADHFIPKYAYGWVKPNQPADHEKTGYRLRCGIKAASALPSKVDLRPQDTPIENQGSLGSCTSFGWAGACKFYFKNHATPSPAPTKPSFWQAFLDALFGRKPTPAPTPKTDPFATDSISHLFIYWNERNMEGTTGSDAGAAVVDGGKVVSELGCPHESTWQYDINRFAVKPPQAAFDDAAKFKVPTPSSVDNSTIDETKNALANGHPVVFGFSVASSFENIGNDGVYTPRGRYVGGHCVCAVGYSDDMQAFICRNSWSTDWGQNGYFYMPYSTYTDTSVTSDCWCIAG